VERCCHSQIVWERCCRSQEVWERCREKVVCGRIYKSDVEVVKINTKDIQDPGARVSTTSCVGGLLHTGHVSYPCSRRHYEQE
jgi:hypothetical protein